MEKRRIVFDCLFRGGHIIQQVIGRNTSGQMSIFKNEIVSKDIMFGKWSVRTSNMILVARITEKQFEKIKPYCREIKIGRTPAFIINKSQILSLHGNTWLKKRYKEIRHPKKKCNEFPIQIIKSPYKN